MMVSGVSMISEVEAEAYKDPKVSMEKRIDDLLKRMTLEEKVDELCGSNDKDKGFMDGKVNTRLGIPPLMFTDGPHGVREMYGTATLAPTLIGMASTWDTDLMKEFGVMIAEETRARGRNIILGPCINIHRHPLGGRNFESMSEDPYLISRMAVAYVKGVQSQKIGTSTKHFAANNQEWERANISVEIDERTLREIYLPGFEAAVKEADTLTVMGAYNKINGDYCCENNHLLKDILKRDWGFQNVVLSDWWAIKNNVKAANNGCDMEMPGPGYAFTRKELIPAINDGRVKIADIDDKVRRVLRIKYKLGLFDGEDKKFTGSINTKEHQALALRAAEESITLLKNDGGLLPLEKVKVKKIAVIGPNAAKPNWGGGGSSQVMPPYTVTPLEGIKNFYGSDVEIVFAQGSLMPGDLDPIPASAFKSNGKTGLKAEYFNNTDLQGTPAVTKTDDKIDFDWGGGGPGDGIGNDNFSARWTGKLIPPVSGMYTLSLLSDDGSRLYIDGQPVINHWSDHGPETKDMKLSLTAGKEYDIKIEFYEKGGGAVMKFGWITPDNKLAGAAAEVAKGCDAAIVIIGLGRSSEAEGLDRANINLPDGQDDLVNAVVAANPNTVVVLMNGTPVDMRKWADKVPAIVEAWYPGMEGGNAIAKVLAGDVNPSGKLTVTMPKRLEDTPAYPNYPGQAGGKVYYREGIFVGYRHYDKNNVEPMYPFGHGLSYTTFEYSGMAVGKAATKDGVVKVSVNVKNTGAREGKEVVQLYVSDKECSVPRPVRELKRFKKINLKPGEQQTVSFELDKRALSYYDPPKHAWVAEPGEFAFLVGSSSRDIRQQITYMLK